MRQHAGNAVLNNSAIPNGQNEACQPAGSAIMSRLQNAVSGGPAFAGVANKVKGSFS